MYKVLSQFGSKRRLYSLRERLGVICCFCKKQTLEARKKGKNFGRVSVWNVTFRFRMGAAEEGWGW